MSASIVPAGRILDGAGGGGWAASFFRRAVLAGLEPLRRGELIVTDPSGRRSFGAASPGFPVRATISVADPAFWRQVALGGSVGAAEAYVRGHWECDDLTALIRILARNQAALRKMEGGAARVGGWLGRLWHATRRNSVDGSRRNIAAHYDLGNDFYSLFLDREMMYSCAWFEKEDDDLDAASLAKMERICRKLDLSPATHLLEIGTGWGGLAIHAARNHGCRVTTTTISEEQYRHARGRVAAEGLEGKVTVLKEDYRSLSGRYDRLVSVEMVEAVGEENLDRFFGICSSLLKPDGRMVLQGITIDERLYPSYRKNPDFIQLMVFPGCHLPSLSRLQKAVAGHTDLRVIHLEDMAPHYARTLREWRARFLGRLDQVRSMGYPESFIRLWEYYLCYCEAGFTERTIGDVQLVLDKPLARRPVRAAA